MTSIACQRCGCGRPSRSTEAAATAGRGDWDSDIVRQSAGCASTARAAGLPPVKAGHAGAGLMLKKRSAVIRRLSPKNQIRDAALADAPTRRKGFGRAETLARIPMPLSPLLKKELSALIIYLFYINTTIKFNKYQLYQLLKQDLQPSGGRAIAPKK
jgi:hypothetical protein